MIKWPENKKFAFSIVDDTDKVTLENVRPVYDYLYKSGVLTTKTVWSLPSRDKFGGESLQNIEYKKFIREISDKGFEIGFHGAGSGQFSREENLFALEEIKNTIGKGSRLYANHALNTSNLYWGSKRFSFPVNKIYELTRRIMGKKVVISLGDEKNSEYFWGDIAKENIDYIRNRVFSDLNTLSYDKYMPYKEKSKEAYSNYWFSSSDGFDCNTFNKLLSKENIDRLEKDGGCAIVYTHFAYGFVDEAGELSKDFKECIDYLVSKEGWFVPTSKVLDYIKSNRKKDIRLNNFQSVYLDSKWFYERVKRKIFGGI